MELKKYSTIEKKIDYLISKYDADLILYMLDEMEYFLKGMDYDFYKKVLDLTCDEFGLKISQVIALNESPISKRENSTNARRILTKILTEKTTFDHATLSRLLKVSERAIYKYLEEFKEREERQRNRSNRVFIKKYEDIKSKI